MLGELFTKGLVVRGDATTTASNILAHQSLYRLGIATGLIATAVYVAMAALFYDLFKPVSRSVSLLAACISLAGCSVQAVGTLFRVAPLSILGDERYLSVFTSGQLQAFAMLSLRLHAQSTNIELVFFGFYDVLLGYLISRSTFLQRTLGALMGMAGLGWLTSLSPPFASHLSPYVQLLGFLAEAALMGWLIAKGVDTQKWARLVSSRDETTQVW